MTHPSDIARVADPIAKREPIEAVLKRQAALLTAESPVFQRTLAYFRRGQVARARGGK